MIGSAVIDMEGLTTTEGGDIFVSSSSSLSSLLSPSGKTGAGTDAL